MKVLLTVASLLPAYGGPARSVSGLAQKLTEQGVDVVIWAPDGSAETTPFLPTGSSVERSAGPLNRVFDDFGKFDVVHDNGIWLPHNHQIATVCLQRSVPRILSLRGMLEPWALRHKWLKKRVAWYVYQRQDLIRAAWHHATSTTEEQSIQRQRLRVPIVVIPNGLDIPHAVEQSPTIRPANSIRTALFVGRIYPVKGLPLLVEAWAKVRPSGWKLRLVGPDEAGHQAQVERLIHEQGLANIIAFEGPLEGESKAAAYREADLFILPSHTENFGMAIGEALSYGVPVLTTKGTPWSSLIDHQCGWWVDVDSTAIAHALREATSLNSTTLQEMGARGLEMARNAFSWKDVATDFSSLYRKVMERTSLVSLPN